MLDLLVIGGGMAGISAGAWAARNDLQVAVVEKGERVGGSAIWAGYVWTAKSAEVLAEQVPLGDPQLGRTLVLGIAEGLEWIHSLDVPCREPIDMLRFGVGTPLDMPAYMSACEKLLRESANAELLTGADTRRLLVEEGRVVGAEVRLADGSLHALHARATLLATGGYQNDRALTADLIHLNAAAMPRRTNPNSDGAGLRLGLAVGGRFGKPGAGFYGHLIPYPIQLQDPSEFVILTLFYSEHGLLLNRSGQRFVDETVADHLSAQRVLEQAGGRALLVADERVRREWIVRPYVDGLKVGDKLEETLKRGGHYAKAHDLEAVADTAVRWGYDGRAVINAMRSFNDTARASSWLLPERRFDMTPIDEPPYHLVEAWPAITFTHGGLLIDSDARVLGPSGEPIPGLFAAGADTGGTYFFSYAGGLALALVFGLRAAHAAANEARALGRPKTPTGQPPDPSRSRAHTPGLTDVRHGRSRR